MANTSLINDYSQQYSNLTSDIIARTAQIPNLSGSKYYICIILFNVIIHNRFFYWIYINIIIFIH